MAMKHRRADRLHKANVRASQRHSPTVGIRAEGLALECLSFYSELCSTLLIYSNAIGVQGHSTTASGY